MTTGQGILLGLGALIGYELFRKTQAAGTINFYPSKVTELQFDGITPVITLPLVAQNTSNHSFTLNSMAGNVFANNYLVGNVSSFVPVTIPRNAQTSIPIKIRLGFLGIVNDIIRAIQTGNITQDLRLESYINVDGLQQPLNLNYKVG